MVCFVLVVAGLPSAAVENAVCPGLPGKASLPGGGFDKGPEDGEKVFVSGGREYLRVELEPQYPVPFV